MNSYLHRGPYHWHAASTVERLDSKETVQAWPREPHMYTINSQGFRGAEFETNCLAAVGCSHTFGYGQLEQDTWPSLLGTALDLPVSNMGWPGAGADTFSRVAMTWFEQLQPRVVCVLDVYPNRREFMISEWQNQIHNGTNDSDQMAKICASPVEQQFNTERNRRCIQNLADEYGSKCVWIDRLTYKQKFSRISTGRPSRDAAQHPSTDCHSAISEYLVKALAELDQT